MEADKTQKLLKEKLKEKGLKVTHQRLLVLSVLEENSGSHMTAEDIYDLVSEDYPEIGLATDAGNYGKQEPNRHCLKKN